MAQTFVIRFSVAEMATVRAALTGMGKDGDAAMQKLGQASDRASGRVRGLRADALQTTPALRALDNASRDVRRGFDEWADRIPVLGGAMRALGPAGTIAAAGIAAIGVASISIVSNVRNAMEAMDDLVTQAQDTNLNVQSFQALRAAAIDTDVPFERLTTNLAALERNSDQAALGQGKLYAALNKTNPELVRQLAAAGSQEERLNVLARAWSSASSETERANIAFAAFGKQGFQMQRILDAIGGSVDNLTDSYTEQGRIIDRDLVVKTAALNDEFEALADRIDVNMKAAFANLAPVVNGAMRALGGAAQEVNRFFDAFKSAEDQQSRTLLEGFRSRVDAMKGASDAMKNGNPRGVFGDLDRAALERFQADSIQVLNSIQELTTRIRSVNSDIGRELSSALDAEETRLKTFYDGVQRTANAALEARKYDEFQVAADAATEARVQLTQIETIRQGIQGKARREREEEARTATAALKEEAATIEEKWIPAQDKLMLRLNRIQLLAVKGGLSRDAAMKERAEAFKEFAESSKEDASAARDREQRERDAIRLRGDLGDITGLLAARQAELNRLVGLGGVTTDDVARTMQAYREQLDGTSEAQKRWQSVADAGVSPVDALGKKISDLSADFLQGKVGPDLFAAALRGLRADMDRLTESETESTDVFREAQAVRDQLARWYEDALTPMQRVAAEQERINKLIGSEGGLSAEEGRRYMEGYARWMREAERATLGVRLETEALDAVVDQSIRSWEDAGLAVQRVLLQMTRDIVEADRAAGRSVTLRGVLGQLLGGNWGSSSAPASTAVSNPGFTTTDVWHDGGVPGAAPAAQQRVVSLAAFRNAKRFHLGLAPGERTAIIQDDERIFSVADNKSLIRAVAAKGSGDAKVEVHVHNETGGQVETRESSTPDGKRRVDVFVRKASVRGMAAGDFDGVMEQRYGITRQSARRV